MRVHKYTKIQESRFHRNYIIVRDQKVIYMTRPFNDLRKNKRHAHHKTHMHAMKVYNTRPSQFCNFFFRPLSGVHLLQSNQCFQAMEFVDRHVSEKL